MSGAQDEARARVREAGGEELCERLEALDAARARRSRAKSDKNKNSKSGKNARGPENGARLDFDVVIAGGGLSLLLAPLLADRGLRVAVLDRSRVGGVHREWNAGEAEVTALLKTGMFSAAEINELVVARYTEGFCRWHGGGTYPVTGVLDCAIDAGGLLARARARAEERGVTIEDRCSLEGHVEGPGGVELHVARGDGARTEAITTRTTRTTRTTKILVDARGAASPFATADLICPTVGGVLSGLAVGDGPLEVRPDVGEILVTTEGVDQGRQHLWEGFPGRPGETTVYLFYYARSEDVPEGSLLSLYARFFALLSRYKQGEAKLERPTFGYIPGWSRLCDPPAPPGRRVVLVGDAAARHSPLTFCGFGATVRSLAATADSIATAAARGGRSTDDIADAPIHAGTGALSMLMATPPRDPARAGSINQLLDAAFAELHAMGNQTYGDLMRDSMSAADFVRFLRATAARRPEVYREVMGSLKLGVLGRWGLGLAKELLRAR